MRTSFRKETASSVEEKGTGRLAAELLGGTRLTSPLKKEKKQTPESYQEKEKGGDHLTSEKGKGETPKVLVQPESGKEAKFRQAFEEKFHKDLEGTVAFPGREINPKPPPERGEKWSPTFLRT